MGIFGDLAPKAQTDEIQQLFKNGIDLALKDASHSAI
jgi:hypothetical protein